MGVMVVVWGVTCRLNRFHSIQTTPNLKVKGQNKKTNTTPLPPQKKQNKKNLLDTRVIKPSTYKKNIDKIKLSV